ncbi:PHD finger protein ALFIN-LIKE 6-like [Homalodisca vitripennis]|uniref:PHD finger protein ALFIN-LIKE 6-like n=1 Tax=Homalodisca vitripennis TaxID=197043 RepID=UPI001EEB3BD9|nr:PHD finger protein ALFIN-LIKE 6-like [Homalodisca vitripennis]
MAIKKEKEDKENVKQRRLEAKIKREIENKQPPPKKRVAKIKNKGKRALFKKKNDDLYDDDDEGNVSDVDCLLFCGDCYSKSKDNEGWIRCSGCLKWAHKACTGAEEEDDEFICDLCKYH